MKKQDLKNVQAKDCAGRPIGEILINNTFKDIVYLDNNATTFMGTPAIKSMVQWINRGNPSSSYRGALDIRKMLENFRDFVAYKCGFKQVAFDPTADYSKDDDDRYVILFTSCSSESNNLILRSVAESYSRWIGKPHFVVGATEHKSILLCAKHLEEIGMITCTYVAPDALGFTRPEAVEKALQDNTALVCVMHGNNETGCINDIAAIGRIAHKRNIPFHTDVVQTFGKFPLDPVRDNVDSFSVSFHKTYGPPSVGMLVVKRKFLHGYRLCACISGSQQYGLRGGTENAPGLAGSFMALKTTWEDRTKKNGHLQSLKKLTMEEISKHLPCKTYKEYLEFEKTNGPKYTMEVVFLSAGAGDKNYLPNTLLLSVVKRSKKEPAVCNVEIKKRLEADGIIVSIGSACSTSDPKASHVLYAMGADENIRKGVIRVSFGDENTPDDVKKFVASFVNILKYFNGEE